MPDIEDQRNINTDNESLTIQEHDCLNEEHGSSSASAEHSLNYDSDGQHGSQQANKVDDADSDFKEEQYSDSINYRRLDDCPVLKKWKIFPGFSILGAVVGLFVGELISMLINVSSILWFIFSIIYFAMMIVYALVIYPSYFKEKPLVKSNRAISFLNLFVGSVIFGCIWNHNLKLSRSRNTPHRGISNIVYAIGEMIIILVMVVSMIFLSLPQGFMERCQNLPDASRPSVTIKNGRVYDSTAGISFSFPQKWEVKPASDEDDSDRCYLYPSGSISRGKDSFFVISYSAYKLNADYWNELSFYDFDEYVSMHLSDCIIEDVDKVKIHNRDGWRVQARGYLQEPGRTFAATSVFFAFHNNGTLYLFELTGPSSDASVYSSCDDALTKIIASTSYE